MAYKDELDITQYKICGTCKEIFYKRKCDSKKYWESRKFCSWGCRRFPNQKKTKYNNNDNNIEFYSRCLNCRQLLNIQSEYYFKTRKFCSHSCSMKYRNEHFDFWPEERRIKKSIKQKQLAKTGRWINPIFMDGVIAKIKETKRNNPVVFSRERTELAAKLAADRIVNGKNRNLGNYKYGKRGEFFSKKNDIIFCYRSSFELQAMNMLEEMKNIVYYHYEPFRISYYKNNIKRQYVPDFLLGYKDGSTKLIEVKPLDKLLNEDTLLKKKYAEKYCIDNKITRGYEIWTETMLFPNRNYI